MCKLNIKICDDPWSSSTLLKFFKPQNPIKLTNMVSQQEPPSSFFENEQESLSSCSLLNQDKWNSIMQQSHKYRIFSFFSGTSFSKFRTLKGENGEVSFYRRNREVIKLVVKCLKELPHMRPIKEPTKEILNRILIFIWKEDGTKKQTGGRE